MRNEAERLEKATWVLESGIKNKSSPKGSTKVIDGQKPLA